MPVVSLLTAHTAYHANIFPLPSAAATPAPPPPRPSSLLRCANLLPRPQFDGGDSASAARRLTSAVRPLTEAAGAVLAWWDEFSGAQVAAARRQVEAALAELGAVTSVQRLQPAVKVGRGGARLVMSGGAGRDRSWTIVE